MTDPVDNEWETEDEVDVARPVAPVISVRFPAELASRVFAEAERRGVRTSTVIRDAVEAYLNDPVAKAATVDLTISSSDAPVTLYTGRSSQGRTASAPAKLLPTS